MIGMEQRKMMDIVEEIRKHYDSDLSIKANLQILDERNVYYDVESMLLYIDIYELYDLED